MGDVKHTPGPWKLCLHLEQGSACACSCGYRGGIWSGDGERIICEMGGSPERDGNKMAPESPREQQFADARLIAAAPDLLAALKSLRNEVVGQLGVAREEIRAAISTTNLRCLERRVEQAEAAISKAEGAPQ